MTSTATATAQSATKALPKPDSDFYEHIDVLTADEKAIVRKVRTYMETKVQPIISKYWSDDAFPFELLPSFKALQLGGLGFEGYGCAGGSQQLFGLVAMEVARVDASFCTFFGVHSSLAMGSIYLDGSRSTAKSSISSITPQLKERIAEGILKEAGPRSVEQLSEQENDVLVSLLGLQAQRA